MTDNTTRDSNLPQGKPSAHLKTTTPHSPGAARDGVGVVPNVRPKASSRPTEVPKPSADTTTDRVTAAFIRRTLCSQNVLLGNGEKARNTPRPIEELLPPLTSSNDVDLQLYAIISVIVKEFIQTWYSKITPDHVFVNEVIQIIAHCTRALEQRLRKVDLEALLLDEIPELLEAHLNAFRLAKRQTLYHRSLVRDARVVYHTLHPHPALSPVPTESVPSSVVEQRENESGWRQLLVQGVLAVLLPTEDLENRCLRALVAEIFAEMILGNGISDKACEGWLLWEGITRIAEVLQDGTKESKEEPSNDMKSGQTLSRLERYGLLGPPSEGTETAKPQLPSTGRHGASWMTISSMFWLVVQYTFLACAAIRALIVALARSSSLPPRSVTGASGMSPVEAGHQSLGHGAEGAAASKRPIQIKRPIVSMKVWWCASQVVELDVRMPWLAGLASLLHWGAVAGPGRVGDTDGVLDRFLSDAVRNRVLNPAFIPILLRTIRATIFPNNSLGPPRQRPSSEETKVIKHRCAATLLGLLPAKVASIFFATNDRGTMLEQMELLLDCLDDSYLNKHFIFQIVELIIIRLVPELGERGVTELLEERLG